MCIYLILCSSTFRSFNHFYHLNNANFITFSLLVFRIFFSFYRNLCYDRPTQMPSMYAEDDELTDEYRCADVRCARALGGQSTSHFISDGYVQYAQPSFNGMVELYQSSASINMCS